MLGASDGTGYRGCSQAVIGTRGSIGRLPKESGAEEPGLHRTDVCAVEMGEWSVSLVNVGELAKALGVEPWELLWAGSA
jgi:hypothetical protein